MYLEAKIYTGDQQVRALPEEAIVEDEGKSYIFIRTPDGHAHEEEVRHAEVSQQPEEEEHRRDGHAEAEEVHGTSF